MLIGSVLALVSAVAYTCANICLRAVAHCDVFWVSCIKAVPTIFVAGAWLIYRRTAGRACWPGWRVIAGVIATGLVAHLGGNVTFQYSLGAIGMALAVPLCFGTLLVGGAVLGWACLAEPVSWRSAGAMTLLVLSIGLLSLGAGEARDVLEPGVAETPLERWTLVMGVASACVSGVAYAQMGVVIRRLARAAMPLATTLLVISLVGLVSLGLCSLARLGYAGLAATTGEDWTRMWWAGIFNAAAFLILSKALEFAPVVHINALNASQTMLAALAGVLIFGEPLTPALLVGVGLSLAGLVLLDRTVEASAPTKRSANRQ